MTAPLLTTRDRLAKILHATSLSITSARSHHCTPWPCSWAEEYYKQADALLASGAVVDVATLAGDEALVERIAAREALSPADGVVWEERCWELQQHLAALADELGTENC